MKFNKNLDWLKESDENDLLGDELDNVKGDEEQINEVRYIDPSNVDKYDPSEIEEVTTASGEKRYKRKTGAQPSNQTVDKKEKSKEEPKQSKDKNFNDFSKEEKDFILKQQKDMPYAKFFNHPKYGVLSYTSDDDTYEDINGNFYDGDDLENKDKLTKIESPKRDIKTVYADMEEDIAQIFDDADKAGRKVSKSKVIRSISNKYKSFFDNEKDKEQIDKLANYFNRLF